MRRTRGWGWGFGVGVLLGALAAGCGPIEDELLDVPPTLTQKVCYRDSDCVMNACCGSQSTGVVHVSEAPTCSGQCTDGCPPNTYDCGRCTPYCRDSVCTAACTVNDGG